MAFSLANLEKAVEHIAEADPVLNDVIKQVGPCKLRPQRRRFELLVRSIISQQISTGAAKSIFRRLTELADPHPLSPQVVLALGADDLRAAGVSPQKAGYLHDLAQKVDQQQVRLNRIGRLGDQQVIEELTQVKGIGKWTAQMFLIFSLARMDVLPVDDFGVRNALKQLHALDDLPRSDEIEQLAASWRPYATIGSWYCWRSLESTRESPSEP